MSSSTGLGQTMPTLLAGPVFMREVCFSLNDHATSDWSNVLLER